jgi:hypothetical protein
VRAELWEAFRDVSLWVEALWCCASAAEPATVYCCVLRARLSVCASAYAFASSLGG